MIIRMRRRKMAGILLLLLGLCGLGLLLAGTGRQEGLMAGGQVWEPDAVYAQQAESIVSLPEDSERFQRPSRGEAYANPYSFDQFLKTDGSAPEVTEIFNRPEEVILAYYGILREASNMQGYAGGCGTIGDAQAPYPYAYSLLSPAGQKEMSLDVFTQSFQGIGHMTLLQLHPTCTAGQYMVEVEMIAGAPENEEKRQGSIIRYYYGLVTAEEVSGEGWRIRQVKYLPEDFLCAPYHGWAYDAQAVAQIVYQENLHLFERIDRTEEEDGLIRLYAYGNHTEYRLDFVRLANGTDVLLCEYEKEEGNWKQAELLTGQWIGLRLSDALAA